MTTEEYRRMMIKAEKLNAEYYSLFGDGFPIFVVKSEELIPWLERCIRLKKDYWDLQKLAGYKQEKQDA
jgi:hypothetical protein